MIEAVKYIALTEL